MKKLVLCIVLGLSMLAGHGQFKLDALEWQGKVTTTVRDAYVVPTGGVYLIWHTNAAQFEYAQDDQVWKALALSAADRTKLNNILITQNVDLDQLETDVAGKEDALGNPSADGQVLSSSAAGVRSWVDPSGGGGTDDQTISLVGSTLTLENGGTVDLSGFLDNTDGQTITDLSLSGNTMSISLSGGNTETVDLSGLGGSGNVSASSDFGADKRVIISKGTGKEVEASSVTVNGNNLLVPGNISASYANLSNDLNFVSSDPLRRDINGVNRLAARYLDLNPTTDFSGETEGDIGFHSTTKKFRGYDGTSWKDFAQDADVVKLTGDQGVDGKKTFFEAVRIDQSQGSNNVNPSKLLVRLGSSNWAGVAPDIGYGGFYFNNDGTFRLMRSTDIASTTVNLGINWNAMTTSKNLIFSDSDITWGGQSLLGGSGGGLTTEQSERINNAGHYKIFNKTGNNAISQEDFYPTSVGDRGKKGKIYHGATVTDTIQVADFPGIGDILPIYPNGHGGKIVIDSNESTVFKNSSGETGDEITLSLHAPVILEKTANDTISVWSKGFTLGTQVTELYTVANWLSTSSYEADSNTGLGTVGVTVASETTIVGEGSYSVAITSTDGASDRMEVDITLEANTTYEIKFYGAEGANANLTTNAFVGFTNSSPSWTPAISNSNGTMQEFTAILTTDGTTSQKLRFYNNGTAATTVYVGGLSITKQ
ncbi:MAG: hypothetical protein AB3N16_07980 [Flavobacteriaceae bacterium]